MSPNTAPPKNGVPDGGCLTRRLTADIYCCVARKSDCTHALAFGYEYVCQHPDRGVFDLEQNAASQPARTP